MSVVEEPEWLPRLRRALRRSRDVGARFVTVETDALESAIGVVQEGPGGSILVAAGDDGMVAVDFRQLLKCIYLTPGEARNLAEVLKAQASLLE